MSNVKPNKQGRPQSKHPKRKMFGLRVNDDDIKEIDAIAEHHNLSQSSIVRMLIRTEYRRISNHSE